MMTKKNKPDTEVYILGSNGSEKGKRIGSKIKWAICGVGLFILIAGLLIYIHTKESHPDYYFEPEQTTEQSASIVTTDSINIPVGKAYVEVREETINDVPLMVCIPHQASMSLELGMPDKSDPAIVYAAMAADIRKDNEEIVGDFVLLGKRMSRGVAKKGFVVIEKNKITIGMGESTPLLEQVIQNNGSFFRQYPLVSNGELVENKPKNKSVRRALAIRNEEVVMVESKNRESFHDFSQALIDIGISDAIYLVGGNAYGWYLDDGQIRKEFGEEQADLPENISYIVWK